MDMNKLFESLDEKVFTDELKKDLTEQFESAVEAKASELAEINEAKVQELVEVKAIEIAAEKIEEKVQELEEKAEEFQAILEQEMNEKEETLLNQVDAYLEKVVDEFVAEAKETLDEAKKAEKSDMIIEAMEAMVVATGVDIMKITEAKDSTDAELKLTEKTKKYDELVEENIKLQKEADSLMKLGIIAELKEGMSVIEAEKFGKLADLVEFSKDSDYISKLETIKESIGTQKSEKIEEKAEEKLEEKTKTSVTTSFSHLI